MDDYSRINDDVRHMDNNKALSKTQAEKQNIVSVDHELLSYRRLNSTFMVMLN